MSPVTEAAADVNDVGIRAAAATVARTEAPHAGRALTVILPIKAGHRAALLRLLEDYGGNIENCCDIAFARLRTAHFLRFVIVDMHADGGTGTLIFESNHDGTVAEHLEDLLSAGSRGLHTIFGHCVGYPVSSERLAATDFAQVIAFAISRRRRNRAFHVAVRGQSVAQIKAEDDVRRAVDAFVDQVRRRPGWPLRPWALYEAIFAHVQSQGLLDRLRSGAIRLPEVSWPCAILGLLRAALPYLPLLPVLPLLALWLRHKERADEAAGTEPDPRAVEVLATHEDVLAQNQITHYVPLKPGLFRRLLLRFVLRGMEVMARFIYNQGVLGGIATIHFARWVIVDRGRHLLFCSNYDGSWESYLGDFIDKAAIGLTGVWSNTVGFPSTRWLVLGGARDEARFKSWTRAHQIPTPLWYTAYPHLTVRNILHNQRICAGLIHRPQDSTALDAWLAGL